jgi:hypothetical protein
LIAFAFGFWAIIQLILNLIPYCDRRKKFQFTGEHMMSFLWTRDDPLYRIFLDIFGSIKGSSIGAL